MYRCKECKAEYKTKVEYCECGNNTFDYIEDKIPGKPQLKQTAMTLEAKSELVSRLFFAICIIISIIVWLIPVKTETKPAEKPKPKPSVTKPKIPDIDTIWDDTPAYYQGQAAQQSVANIPEQIRLTQASAGQERLSTNNYTQTQNKPVKKNSSNTSVTKQSEYEIVYNPPPVSKKKEILQQHKPVEPPKPVYNPNSPVMLKYKGDLRAALFSKFAAGSIPGSGSCEIEFSVDKTGKLINRKFSRESDNKTLNDVVYYMLMSVPKFTPPPAEYSGQKIRMKFVINNGSYEISIN